MGKAGIIKSFSGDMAEGGFYVLWQSDCLSTGCLRVTLTTQD